MDPLASLFARFAAHGDVDALGEVFDRTAPRLLRLAMHLAKSSADAEDLLQATFVLAMKKAPTFAPDQPLLPWLAGMLAGEAKNLARRNVHRRTEPLPDLVDADAGARPDTRAERAELVASLRAHVEDLPSEQRQALLLQLQHGLSPTDIAEVLEVPPGTVRMRLHRGLAALRKLLPSALAVWLFGALGTRGLAAVRTAVLREAGVVARGASAAGTAAIAAGVLSMKYVFAGAAVLLAALLCWWLATPAALAPTDVAPHDAIAAIADVPSDVAAPGAVERIAANATPTPALPDGTGSLRVRLSTVDGARPLRDVAIRASPGDEALALTDPENRLARTGDDGVAVFDRLPAGPWRIAAFGFPQAFARVTIAAAHATEHEFALHVRSLRGIVVDRDGNPIAGATVRLCCQEGDFGPLDHPGVRLLAHLRSAACTASDGTFATDVGPRESKVAAVHPAFASSFPQLTDASGAATLRLVLQARTVELAGVVLDENRQPIAGATVVARVFAGDFRERDGTWLDRPLAESATSDAAGRYALSSLPPGPTSLFAVAPGRLQRDTFVATIAGRNDAPELVLPRALVVTGTVREHDGSPAAQLTVAAVRSVAGLPQPLELANAPTNTQGRFAFAAVPTPPFALLVRGDGARVLLRHEVTQLPGAALHVDLALPPLFELRGRVLDDAGAPLVGWSVAASDADSDREADTYRASTDAEGRFVVRHLHAARLRVAAMRIPGDPRTAAVERSDVSPLAGELLLRVPADRMPRGRVAGRFVDGAGQAIAGADVDLLSSWAIPSTATRADGSFAFERVPAGEYSLVVTVTGQPARAVRGVAMHENAVVELGDVPLLAIARLRIDVLDRDGAHWRGTLPCVFVEGPGDEPRLWQPQMVDGAFEGDLEPGPVRLRVDGTDLIAAPRDLELLPGERRTVQIPVDIGRRLEVVFAGDRDAKIDPKDVLRLEVVDERGAVVLRDEVRRSPHGDGNWTLDHTFAFGSYEVTARTDSDRRYRAKFTVDDARSSSRRVEVPRLP